MNNANNWYVLAGKQVWPVCIGIFLVVFSQQPGKFYSILIERIEKDSAPEFGGLSELGEMAGKTEVSELLFRDLPIEAMDGMKWLHDSKTFIQKPSPYYFGFYDSRRDS
jgi:hypothetical protein